ncbi:Gamma histone variant H2AX [Hibiscus syriacus]|uniref:Gamma histone variant H2AX n=1 Tax=Hibiscus syriacus TaxID=106335 RepID=A0A6A2YLF8_HIBSY|nr:protein VAPYRIN-LIKE-like [Hibiscus syriacus]KAE8679614.1 Gamma histone variant H2AX [Hibiscus syriacus]
MDRLVKADVKGIELVFIRGQKSSTTFTLTNLMHTMSVAVSLSTKTPAFLSFNKPLSIIPPLSSSSYTLLSQPSDQPPLTDPPDAITVKTTMLTVLLKSAAVSGKANLVRSLIDRGGDVNHKDSNGRSLISLAVEAGHLDVVNVLISSGCEIDNSVDHVFHYAAAINSVDLMDALFRAYGNTDSIDSVDFHGRTPIHISAIHGYTEVTRFCLTVGASPDVLDINKCTPLHLAAKGGHLDIVECLLEASNYTKYALNKQGKTAFALAFENDCSNVYDSLQLSEALSHAAWPGDVNGIKSCIGKGANVNGRDQNGSRPLHRAAFKGHVEVALLLIGQGAKGDLKSLKGMGMGVRLKSDGSKNHRCYQSCIVQPWRNDERERA